ncbi:MAG: hypothetical protein ACJAVI_000135 [Candidatus Azotimanducaceae bacterium]|jgi:hypothetical protein
MTFRMFLRAVYSARTCLTVAATLFLCVSIITQAQAQNQSDDDRAIEGAMGAMNEFMLAFNDKDSDAWAATLNYPHVRFASGTVTVWDNAEEFSDTKTFQTLARSGWDHSHWLTREVVLVSSDKVHIAALFQRFNGDNEIIGTYQSLYIVTQVNGHWGTQARSSLAP